MIGAERKDGYQRRALISEEARSVDTRGSERCRYERKAWIGRVRDGVRASIVDTYINRWAAADRELK